MEFILSRDRVECLVRELQWVLVEQNVCQVKVSITGDEIVLTPHTTPIKITL